MKVIKNNIMVSEPKEEEKKSASGIIIQNTRVDYSKPKKAVVVDTGAEVMYVHPGDVVYYEPAVGITIEQDDLIYRIFPEDSVVAVEG